MKRLLVLLAACASPVEAIETRSDAGRADYSSCARAAPALRVSATTKLQTIDAPAPMAGT